MPSLDSLVICLSEVQRLLFEKDKSDDFERRSQLDREVEALYRKEARTWVGRYFKYPSVSGGIGRVLKVDKFRESVFKTTSLVSGKEIEHPTGHFIGVSIILWPKGGPFNPEGGECDGFKTIISEESDWYVVYLAWMPTEITESEFNVIFEAGKKAKEAGEDFNKYLSDDYKEKSVEDFKQGQVRYEVMGRIM